MENVTITHEGQETANISSFHIRHQIEGLVVFRPTELCAMITASDSANKEFVETHNIKAIRMGTAGGCIVAFPDNLEIGLFSKDVDNTFLERLTPKVVDFLKGKGLNVSLDNNDVLIDGKYKVFSTCKAVYDKTLLLGAVHVSINCDADLVDKICTKPMKKIPKGLSEYGITSDEMLDLVLGVYEEE